MDTKVLILGSGPAALTAAIYAARADLQPTILAGPEPGGQLMWTTEVENFPGFPKGIQGPELMQAMKDQAVRFGTTYLEETVSAIDLSKQPYTVTTENGIHTAASVILATGASAKWLGLPNEQRLRGKGVSACATCDGFFFRNKEVVVIGGGDSAMEEATFLTKFASKVTVLVRGDKLRASKAMIHRAEMDPKISFRFNTDVLDVLGDQTINGLRLKNNATNVEEEFPTQGMFLAIGHQPNTAIFGDQLAKVGPGYLKVENQVFSSKPGVFIAGDVADWRYRQAVTAAGWGCMAALEAEKFLAEQAADAS